MNTKSPNLKKECGFPLHAHFICWSGKVSVKQPFPFPTWHWNWRSFDQGLLMLRVNCLHYPAPPVHSPPFSILNCHPGETVSTTVNFSAFQHANIKEKSTWHQRPSPRNENRMFHPTAPGGHGDSPNKDRKCQRQTSACPELFWCDVCVTQRKTLPVFTVLKPVNVSRSVCKGRAFTHLLNITSSGYVRP